MEPIKFNYPPRVAEEAVDDMVRNAEKDPECNETIMAIYKDIQTLVKFATKLLTPVSAPGGTGEHKN